MRSYLEKYHNDEVCTEKGHEKLAGQPCAQCEEEANLPLVLRTSSLPAPPFATCQMDTPKSESDT